MLAQRAGPPLTESSTHPVPTLPPDPVEARRPWQVASWGLVSTLAATGLSYVFQILVARFMGPRSYSEAVAMLSLFMLCSLPLAPIFLLVTRRVVDARLSGSESDIRALLLTLASRIGLASLIGIVVATIARAPLADWLRLSDATVPPLFASSVAANALYLLVSAVLYGRMNWAVGNTLQVLLAATRILFSLFLVRPGFEVSGTFIAITLSALLCLAIGAVAALRGIPRGGHGRPLRINAVALAITVNLAFWFLVQLDTIYVKRVLPDVAERYAAASQLGKMLVYIPVAVGNVLFPLLAAARSAAAGRTLLLRMLMVVILLDLAGYVLIAAAPERLLLVTLGPTHVAAAALLVPVAAVLAPFALASVFMYDALARHDWPLAAIFAAAAVMAAVSVAAATPSLPALFTILLASAAVTIVGGLIRSFVGRDSRSRPGALDTRE